MTIVELQSVGSTNDHAKELAKGGAESGTVVWAHEQTAGRGRQGNSWVSNKGNLFMTIILRPKIAAADVGQISFLSALALANVLEQMVVPPIGLKWPNDLLIDGKKAAGILIESEGAALSWVVVGIGVNIEHAPDGAISLKDAGVSTDARTVMEAVAFQIQKLMDQWQREGFSRIRDAWLKRAYKLGGEIRARLPQETLTGVFEGIDAAGALQLRTADGIRTINSGEVFL